MDNQERGMSDFGGGLDSSMRHKNSYMGQSFDRQALEDLPLRMEIPRTGSLLGPSLLHVSTQPSFRSPLKPTDTSALFDKFSHDFVHELEKQHERALSNAYFKLSAQEENHGKIAEALKSQVTALRQQIEASAQLQEKEDARKRREFDEAVKVAMGEKERTLVELGYRLAEQTKLLELQTKQNLELREELAGFKAQFQEEMAQAKATITDYEQELETLKSQALLPAEKEIERLRGEKKSIKEDYERLIQALKRDHQDAAQDLQKKIESKDSLIDHLETEVNEVRRQMAVRGEAVEREITDLQDNIRTLRRVLETQDEEVKRLKKAREGSSKEARLLEKETTLLEHELARMRKDNDDLRGHGFRMERLVYGKGPKKATKVTR